MKEVQTSTDEIIISCPDSKKKYGHNENNTNVLGCSKHCATVTHPSKKRFSNHTSNLDLKQRQLPSLLTFIYGCVFTLVWHVHIMLYVQRVELVHHHLSFHQIEIKNVWLTNCLLVEFNLRLVVWNISRPKKVSLHSLHCLMHLQNICWETSLGWPPCHQMSVGGGRG